MFECPLCRKEWLLVSKLCDKGCEDIRHLISIYGKDNILNVLRTNLIRPQEKLDEVFKKCEGYKNINTSSVSINENTLNTINKDRPKSQ
tara:strand:+ start:3191 stop:3457 length:267 start_codon:yes stop_codon:yes gene_type:complete